MSPESTASTSDRESTIAVGIVVPGTPRRVVDEHLDELERLIETAGGRVVDREVQERRAPDPSTIIGSGFAARLSERCAGERVRTVVFDEDLTGSQVRGPSDNAWLGQSFEHFLQLSQNSTIPSSAMGLCSRGMSVNTLSILTIEPCFHVMSLPCLPRCPSPA